MKQLGFKEHLGRLAEGVTAEQPQGLSRRNGGLRCANTLYGLANFKQVVKDTPVRIHPIVGQLVDPAVLEKMKVRPVGEAEAEVG